MIWPVGARPQIQSSIQTRDFKGELKKKKKPESEFYV